jgi:predicted sulfurtransferase
MNDFTLNDMVDFFAQDKDIKVVVFDEEGAVVVEKKKDKIEKCAQCQDIATPHSGLLRLKNGTVFHWECALKLRRKSNRSVFKKHFAQQIEDIE